MSSRTGHPSPEMQAAVLVARSLASAEKKMATDSFFMSMCQRNRGAGLFTNLRF